jgi:hypothetical protein
MAPIMCCSQQYDGTSVISASLSSSTAHNGFKLANSMRRGPEQTGTYQTKPTFLMKSDKTSQIQSDPILTRQYPVIPDRTKGNTTRQIESRPVTDICDVADSTRDATSYIQVTITVMQQPYPLRNQRRYNNAVGSPAGAFTVSFSQLYWKPNNGRCRVVKCNVPGRSQPMSNR